MIRATTVSTVDDLNAAEWDSFISTTAGGRECSVAFLRLLEDAFSGDYSFRYVTVRDDERQLLLASPVFATTDVRLETVLPQSPYRSWLEKIRWLNPRWLPHRALIVGTPWNDEFSLGDLRLMRAAVLEPFLVQIERLRQAENVDMIVFRNLVDGHEHEALLRPRGYVRVEGLPNATINCENDSFDDYLAARLDANRRHNVRNKLRRAKKAGYDLEVRRGADVDVAALAWLFESTYLKSSHRFERPTLELLRLLARSRDLDVTWVLIKQLGKIVAAVYCFSDGDWLVAKRMGQDYSSDVPFLYFVVHYELIMYAIERRLKGIKLGPTGYSAKHQIGADFEPVFLFIKHENPLVQEMIGLYDVTARLHWSFEMSVAPRS